MTVRINEVQLYSDNTYELTLNNVVDLDEVVKSGNHVRFHAYVADPYEIQYDCSIANKKTFSERIIEGEGEITVVDVINEG